MGALKLCTYKKAEYPLYLEMLSLHVYTMEELCYAMESSLFLLDDFLRFFKQWVLADFQRCQMLGIKEGIVVVAQTGAQQQEVWLADYDAAGSL